jgi:hypothetical protein
MKKNEKALTAAQVKAATEKAIATKTKEAAEKSAPAAPEVITPEIPAHHILIPALAKELGILPKSLRSKLRKSKSGYKKAGKVWHWDPKSPELAAIRKEFAKEEKKEEAAPEKK